VPHLLQVGTEKAFCLDVGMAYPVAYLRLFAANIALSGHIESTLRTRRKMTAKLCARNRGFIQRPEKKQAFFKEALPLS
jgi:hypothetical protein